MHERSSKRMHMGTARLKQDKEREEEVKQKSVKIKNSKEGTKQRCTKCLTIACAYLAPGNCSEAVDELST